MTKSEQAKASKHEDGIDMISRLPDEVLQLILSRITSTEEVIRTSILSTRWRYLWTSIPSLEIDCTRGLLGFEGSGIIGFLIKVLLLAPQDLDSFRLWCPKYSGISFISPLIYGAVMRKVKIVDLMVFFEDESELLRVLDGLVICRSLEVLKLCLLGHSLDLPDITGLQALRVLELKEARLFDGDDGVNYLLKNCPLLEDLSLIDCEASEISISCSKLKNLKIVVRKEDLITPSRICSCLEISCPKLEFLELTGFVASKFFFESLYSLKEALIHVEDIFLNLGDPFDLFSRISHVESLSISVFCIRRCFNPEVDAPISLPNLKTLEITVDWMNMDALIKFLIRLPDVESLHLIFPEHIYLVHKWNLEEAETINILTRHLKKVEFLEFDEEKEFLEVDEDELKLAIARVLLEHGNELEEMVFSWSDEAKFHERSMETMNQVSKFHKASSTVKLTCVTNQPEPTRVLDDSIHIKTISRG